MRENPFEGLIVATAAFDAEVREISGKCSRCGLDRGGIVRRGQSKREAGICACKPAEEIVCGEARFVRKHSGARVSLTCPGCGYKQYDIKASSARGHGAEAECARCGARGPVEDVRQEGRRRERSRNGA